MEPNRRGVRKVEGTTARKNARNRIRRQLRIEALEAAGWTVRRARQRKWQGSWTLAGVGTELSMVDAWAESVRRGLVDVEAVQAREDVLRAEAEARRIGGRV